MTPRSLNSIVAVVLLSAVVHADIPAPKEAQPIDWGFVLMGAASAFLGGLLFVWLGRRLFKRPQ